jgi:hypothetical protein
MTERTPKRVVEMYNDDVWGRHRREPIVELVGITDVWNPNAVAEQYPAGPWPEFRL